MDVNHLAFLLFMSCATAVCAIIFLGLAIFGSHDKERDFVVYGMLSLAQLFIFCFWLSRVIGEIVEAL